jgi:hypothetical protein
MNGGAIGEVLRDEHDFLREDRGVDPYDGDPQPTTDTTPVDDPNPPAKHTPRCLHRVPRPGGVTGFGTCWEPLVDGRCPTHQGATR